MENFYKRMLVAAIIGEAVSHKINNSLSGILGYVQFAQEKISKNGNDTDKILKYLKTAEREAEFSRNLMADLKWFSKIYLEQSSSFINDVYKEEDIIDVFHSFWAEVSGKGFFSNCTINWLVEKGRIKTKIGENQLLCIFYITIMNILKYTGFIDKKEEKLVITVQETESDSFFTGIKLSFRHCKKGIKDIYKDFAMIEALIKAVYGKLEIEEDNETLSIVLDFAKR